MAITSSRVSVAATATKIVDKPAAARARNFARVKNTGSATVFLGGSGVTSAAGYALAAAAEITLDVDNNDVLYGITASGTNEVSVIIFS